MSDSTSGGTPKSRNQRRAMTYGGKYESGEFIVPASDTKGHSARATFRLSVSMSRELDVIVASKLFPFHDTSDLLRWCVREGLLKLNAMEDVPNSVMGQANAAIEIGRELLYQKQYEATFQTMDEAIEMCRARGAMTEIRRLYARVKAKFDAMPEGYWRTYYLGELARRYLHLIDPGASRPRELRGPDRIGMARDDEAEVG